MSLAGRARKKKRLPTTKIGGISFSPSGSNCIDASPRPLNTYARTPILRSRRVGLCLTSIPPLALQLDCLFLVRTMGDPTFPRCLPAFRINDDYIRFRRQQAAGRILPAIETDGRSDPLKEMVIVAYGKVYMTAQRPGRLAPPNCLSKHQIAAFRSGDQAVGGRFMMQNEPRQRVRAQLFYITVSAIRTTGHRQLLARR
jgi:hypothetical protein